MHFKNTELLGLLFNYSPPPTGGKHLNKDKDMEKQNVNVALTESQIIAVISAVSKTNYIGDDGRKIKESILDQLDKAFDHRETLFDS